MLNRSLKLPRIGSSLLMFLASMSLVGCTSSCGGNKVDLSPNPQNTKLTTRKTHSECQMRGNGLPILIFLVFI